jgi:hypothetical protein
MNDKEKNNVYDMSKIGEKSNVAKKTLHHDNNYFSLDLSKFSIVESEPHIVFIDLEQNFKSGMLQFDYELDKAELELVVVGCMM